VNSAAGLGVFIRYGIGPMTDALAALRQGTATPEQQRMAWDLIDAVSSR
jgi:hypothetical protein